MDGGERNVTGNTPPPAPGDVSPLRRILAAALRPGRALGAFLGLVAVVMMASIIGIFVVLEREQSREAASVISSSPWATVQVYAESLRTLMAVTEVLSHPGPPTAEDLETVRGRFDVFFSRISIFQDSRRALQLPPNPELEGPVASAAMQVERIASLLDGVTDPAAARPVLADMQERMSTLVPEFATLLARVRQLETLDLLAVRSDIKALYRLLAVAVFGLALSMMGLLIVLVWQMRAAARTQARVEMIERENLAKSLALQQSDEQAALLRREAALAETINAFNTKLNSSVTRLAAKIEDITVRCTVMTQVVETARQGSELARESSARVAEHVSAVAQTADAMSHAARDMATKSAETSDTAQDVRVDAERTGEAIQELASAASHISSITKLIASIAGRTNLLALNATIEAARAGESGRGFAVVAAEVKSLAQRTSDATSDIARQIQSIQAATISCIEAMGGIHARIGALGAIGVQIGAITASQSQSVEHVAQMIRDATHETSAASSTARSVSVAAVDANAAAEAVLGLLVELNAEGRRIRREIEHFQERIRGSAETHRHDAA